MASVNIFESLRARVEKSGGLLPQERRAMYWFQTSRRELMSWQAEHKDETFSAVSSSKFNKQIVPPKTARMGCLYFFLYSPIHKDSLPYYDRFPLVVVLEKDEKGFLGLNLHYLPYRLRAMFFDMLHSARLMRTKDPFRTRLMVTYKMLKSVTKYRAFKPCVKRYRYSSMRTALLQVGETEWDIALFLPVEQFAKSTRTNVWGESLAGQRDTGLDDLDS
jgi:hypothetical protein